MPKSKHRKNAHDRPHRAMPKAVRDQADAMTHHDSPPGDHNPKMTHHDSPPGDENPPMTQNDSLCHDSDPEMTQNDSLCKPSMTQMTQNDSHFEVSSFEMTQNDSFTAQKCPTEHPVSQADEPEDDPENAPEDGPAGPAVSSEATHPSPDDDDAGSDPDSDPDPDPDDDLIIADDPDLIPAGANALDLDPWLPYSSSSIDPRLTQKQRHALPCIAAAPSLTDAARLAGIERRTIYRWLEQEPFRLELTRLRSATASIATGELQAAVLHSISVLVDLTRSSNETIRFRASRHLLNLGLRFGDLQQIAADVQDLRDAADLLRQTR